MILLKTFLYVTVLLGLVVGKILSLKFFRGKIKWFLYSRIQIIVESNKGLILGSTRKF